MLQTQITSRFHCGRIPTGLEHIAFSPEKPGVVNPGNAQNDAISGNSLCTNPELAELIEAWPALPQAVRSAITQLVHAAPSVGGNNNAL